MAVVEWLQRVVGNLPKATILVVLHGLDDSSFVVHHERSVGNDRFLDWLTAKQENLECVVS